MKSSMPTRNIMTDKRAFFVVGPESSGTRFVQRSFISAGCTNKRDWMFNENDGKHNFNPKTDIVFHRSIPHQRVIPDLKMIRLAMENSGFNVIPLLVVRDWHCTISSQIFRGISKDSEEAGAKIRKAIAKVAVDLPDFLLITYETFCRKPGFRRWLLTEKYGLQKPTEPIFFMNDKYYEEQK